MGKLFSSRKHGLLPCSAYTIDLNELCRKTAEHKIRIHHRRQRGVSGEKRTRGSGVPSRPLASEMNIQKLHRDEAHGRFSYVVQLK